MPEVSLPRILFLTGRLAEPSLRAVLRDLAPKLKIDAQIEVLPITVAALLTTDWIDRHITIPGSFDRVILPGFCRGELTAIRCAEYTTIERGPIDLRDLPEYFGLGKRKQILSGEQSIEIIAEINHAPRKSIAEILEIATQYRTAGADRIDLGSEPGTFWHNLPQVVERLREAGFQLSVDTFDPKEVHLAIAAGVDLVFSVNGTNRHHLPDWLALNPNLEVVVIPDTPSDLDSLEASIGYLEQIGCKYRIDPILEPIGFGFAASLGRYLEVRRRFPQMRMLMGIGNLTELTDVDSAGVNVLLAGFCQELSIGSVLTTQVISWCQTAIREFDLARRLVFHAVREKVLPKHLHPGLVMLRDTKIYELGEEGLRELASRVTDRNYRIIAERGEIHIINGSMYLHGSDPFLLFEQMRKQDPKLDLAHAFYLGYEMAKAVTALTLGKSYTQDQALRWGILTVPEMEHRH